MTTLLLDGTLTAVTPIAIIVPAKDRRTEAGAPRKRMLRDGEIVETVYVPPSSLRGRLRHLLTNELMRLQHLADDRVFGPEDYIESALGGIKDRSTEDSEGRRVALAAIRETRARNPVVSLFGSMSLGIAGRLMVGDMTPVEPLVPANTGRSVRADPFVRNPAIVELLDPARFEEFDRLNEARKQANRDEKRAKKIEMQIRARKGAGAEVEAVAALEGEHTALDRRAKDGFRLAGGAVNFQQPLDGYDIIPEGTVMRNRIRLIEGSEVEAALLLLALNLLAKRPLIGGHTAHGCGEIAGAWEARVQDANGLSKCGTLRLEPFVGLQPEGVSGYLQAAQRRAAGFAAEVLSYDFTAHKAGNSRARKEA